MARKGLSVCVEKVRHIDAVTLKLRSRLFSHKSGYLGHLMRYPPGQGQIFIAKCYILDIRILTVILAVYLLGIAPTGEQCWHNARFALQDHCVTFKFRYKI